MASRFHRWDSIYARLKGLLEHGGMRKVDKPLWYDLYERFPPMEEPTFGRQHKNVPIINIFYPEDNIRAKIQKTYYKNLGVIDLSENMVETNSQMWIKQYQNEISVGVSEEDALNKIMENIQKPKPSGINMVDIFSDNDDNSINNEKQ